MNGDRLAKAGKGLGVAELGAGALGAAGFGAAAAGGCESTDAICGGTTLLPAAGFAAAWLFCFASAPVTDSSPCSSTVTRA